MSGRRWTEKEMDFLERYWGIKSLDELTKKFRRSRPAVSSKAYSMGLSSQIYVYDGLTVKEIIKAMGIADGGKSYRRLEKLGLPFSKSTSLRNKKVKVVRYDDFWNWLRNHQELINVDRFEEFALGAEPIWMKNLRKATYEERWKDYVEEVWRT